MLRRSTRARVRPSRRFVTARKNDTLHAPEKRLRGARSVLNRTSRGPALRYAERAHDAGARRALRGSPAAHQTLAFDRSVLVSPSSREVRASLAAPAAPAFPPGGRRVRARGGPVVHQAGTLSARAFVALGERVARAATPSRRARAPAARVRFAPHERVPSLLEAPRAPAFRLEKRPRVSKFRGRLRPFVFDQFRRAVRRAEIFIPAALVSVAPGEGAAAGSAARQRAPRAPAALVRGTRQPESLGDSRVRRLAETPAAARDSDLGRRRSSAGKKVGRDVQHVHRALRGVAEEAAQRREERGRVRARGAHARRRRGEKATAEVIARRRAS